MRIRISVDGKEYEVEKGDNLLHACLSHGLDIPYFCWHPALGSVGSCRQCAVKSFKDENDGQGKLVMACMEAAGEKTRISIDDAEAVEFRKQVIEWLMLNHPHDCPVCDEGGECHLQDMTVMTGHDYRRYRFTKRTHRNQYLGPFINHEMNRCIACYRCVRYYRDFAGGKDLDVFGAHDHVYFGRHEDGVLESPFSGNLVEVCPTGVFTDKTLKEHYTRKWDLQTAPSVCVHCSLGCNTIPGERYGEVRRILNRYHPDINGYFLCDRGRFGYDFVNDEKRVREPLVRSPESGEPESSGRDAALEAAKACLADGRKVVGIGSPRASLESNFALRELVGEDRFFAGTAETSDGLVQQALDILRRGPAPSASLREVERSDAVLVLGEDPTHTAPMLALALRQAARQEPLQSADAAGIPRWHDAAVRELLQEQRGPLFVATPTGTLLDEIASETWRGAPDDVARLGFAVAHALDGNAPAVKDLPKAAAALAARIAEALAAAERPVVVSGTGASSPAVLQAAANVASAMWVARQGREVRSRIFLTLPECNSLGVAMLGGGSLADAVDLVREADVDTLVVLENDLYRRAERRLIDELLEGVTHLVVIDHLETETSRRARVVLPAATFAEGDGTLVNNEGRAQRFYQVFAPKGGITESWRWLRDAARAAGRRVTGWETLADLHRGLDGLLGTAEEPVAAGARHPVPPKVPRGSHRYSGRTAMHAHVDVHEPPPPRDEDSSLAFSMEGWTSPEASIVPAYWAPAWNSVQALNKFQLEIGGPLRGGDPGRRLIAPQLDAPQYFLDVPEAFSSGDGKHLLVPRHHMFGDEELSALAPAVAERIPGPTLTMSPEDAQSLGVDGGESVELAIGEDSLRITAELQSGIPRGLAGLPVHLPGNGFVRLPTWASIGRAGK